MKHVHVYFKEIQSFDEFLFGMAPNDYVQNNESRIMVDQTLNFSIQKDYPHKPELTKVTVPVRGRGETNQENSPHSNYSQTKVTYEFSLLCMYKGWRMNLGFQAQ